MQKYKNIIISGLIFLMGLSCLYMRWNSYHYPTMLYSVLGLLLGIITIIVKIHFVRKNGKNFFVTFGSYSAAVTNVLFFIDIIF